MPGPNNSKQRCYHVVINREKRFKPVPTRVSIYQWIEATLKHHAIKEGKIEIYLADKATSQKLNQRYRGKDYPTNILSFPQKFPHFNRRLIPMLGEMILCAPIINEEAQQQQKTWTAHWAHLIIHGTLHLLGYDHVEPKAAAQMENLEITLLAKFGIANPYEESNI